MIRLETLLDSLNTVRRHTAQAVEDMRAGELDFRPAPDVMTFSEIARHILNASQGLIGMLLAGDEDFTVGFRDRLKDFASPLAADAPATELAAELRKSAEEFTAKLARQTPEFFAKVITRFDGQKTTRMELVQMVKEHEMTHRAQMFLYLRLKGVVPSTTRQRMAQQGSR
jgi:uncharacterized damage-inducible protein DinB